MYTDYIIALEFSLKKTDPASNKGLVICIDKLLASRRSINSATARTRIRVRKSSSRAIRRSLTNKTAARTILSQDAVRTSAILFSRNRDTTSKSGKKPITTYSVGAVIRAASNIKNTAGIDNKSLNIQVASSKKLASVDSVASNNRSKLIVAKSLTGVV